MMGIFWWMVVAWAGSVVMTALRAHGGLGYIAPDPIVIVVTHLALKREPVPMMLAALVLGYIAGRGDIAPTGLYSLALGITALGTHLIAGSLAATGPLFFALCCGAAVASYHALLFLLLLLVRGYAGFASWTTFLLLPNAVLTAFIALLFSPLIDALERKLTPEQRSALSWR